ncbi:hypothetical protein A3I27_03190 [Candidatus Giovannonibacteria bacterium RIFCSPLOWO2_02_FULL_43_11b]|uniref:Uncharacterized protein n=1 Tax=Candidatus Giovannonibacteria bacterium RIFCSPHIGHO2_12_FULL_43_15 TaxID=1798341 RepID=A0A1F5WP59_9BACT|nr:MAG: hypothetical protein A3B97_01650 [Candidatus Giovannonibacteria bacterium RIFCSPHIGHO2_02_FULL_43_32]OGF77438.1 MAG: hypothetical protein A3F23_01700 [Candidatus Giovannonibacteria bacterium RIFCSPHIGHO2_12_FULL_43_15]OGF89371.1 MAG: hypothetical protein A3I27_03190 [Candidatus Giovannonibacteria bacterium RIFCSPLOWO2_02_FULL_43_11b]OGF92148.1 MAG: hypothetical protein A3H04_00760 [Candidatus Giovannonibacteria bacterium RIFCSPLOWO2_12_FULL_43_11c]
MQKFVPLFKKRPGKIVFLSVIQIIPLVGPPAFLAINCIRRVFREIGNHVAFAKIALALIEIENVKSRQTPLKAAFGTKSWRRDGDFLVKFKVFGIDDKLGFTVLAIACFAHSIFKNSFS